jgi:hypothetical protein
MNMREWTAKIATIVVILSMPGALALSQRETTILRTVRGTVVDQQGTPLPSSAVYLHRQQTHEVRTHITDGSGQYRFSGLHPYGDYEIHAKHGGRTSSVHRLYAANGKRDVVLDLKVDRKEKSKTVPAGSSTYGGIFVVFADEARDAAGITRNWHSEHDRLCVAYNV